MDNISVGIDATNISSGGGLNHLVEMLRAADPLSAGIHKVIVFCSSKTAGLIPIKPWLEIITPSWTNGRLLRRVIGQQILLNMQLRATKCNILFSPGGTLPWKVKIPTVTMSQNMLPFEVSRAKLFGCLSLMRIKLLLLRVAQERAFYRAQGLIFLSNYAHKSIASVLGEFRAKVAKIPHGIETRFFNSPRVQRPFKEFTTLNPCRILYVSILMPYKHQVEVVEAVNRLRAQGFPVEISFVGELWGWYGKKVLRLISCLDPNGEFLRLIGYVEFMELHKLYKQADLFLFASSCENLPNILIEAMAAGLPVLASEYGPMPEVLGDAGSYFDPESPDSIANSIIKVAKDINLRELQSQAARAKAKAYSWEKCASETFEFIAHIARCNAEKRHV